MTNGEGLIRMLEADHVPLRVAWLIIERAADQGLALSAEQDYPFPWWIEGER